MHPTRVLNSKLFLGENKINQKKVVFCWLLFCLKSSLNIFVRKKNQKVGGFAKSPDFSEVSNCLMRTIYTAAEGFFFQKNWKSANPVLLFEQALVRYLVNTNSWCNQPCISAPEVAALKRESAANFGLIANFTFGLSKHKTRRIPKISQNFEFLSLIYT